MVKVTPEEKSKKLIRQIVIECEPFTPEEVNYLTQAVKLPDVRSIVCEFLFCYGS